MKVSLLLFLISRGEEAKAGLPRFQSSFEPHALMALDFVTIFLGACSVFREMASNRGQSQSKLSIIEQMIELQVWVIDQACSLKMAGYLPSSRFACLWTETAWIEVHKLGEIFVAGHSWQSRAGKLASSCPLWQPITAQDSVDLALSRSQPYNKLRK